MKFHGEIFGGNLFITDLRETYCRQNEEAIECILK